MGEVLFSIGCGENKHGRGDIGLGVTGRRLDNEVVRWAQRTLHVGDQVHVKIVETKTADESAEVLQPPPRDSRKYEKA